MRRSCRAREIAGVALLTTLASCTTAAQHHEPARSLRVMTYNIFAGNDLERQSNLARIAALIDSLRIDIVFMQEVDRRTARSGGMDQTASISELAGMHAAFGPAMEFDGGEYGIAILSRWPLLQSRVLPLDEAGSRSAEPRVALHAIVTVEGRQLHLLNTHLDHRADPAARAAQADQLLRFVEDSIAGRPLVAAGDLNARPDAPELSRLLSAFSDTWQRCGTGTGYTFRADRPDRRIDYVLLRGATCTVAYVPDIVLSDHLPVVVDVRIDATAQPAGR